MLRLRSLTVTLALFVLIAVPLAAQRVVRPDPKALEAARSLVARRTALADVAAQMQRTYRQSAPQTTAIFKALRTSPSAAAPAVMRGYRLSGTATTTALLQGGYSQSETVVGARKAGVRVADLTGGLRSAGIASRDVAAAFRDAGIPEQETLSGFQSARVDAAEATKAVVATYGGSAKRLAGSLELAGYPTAIIYLLYKDMGFSPAEFVEAVREDGMDWEEAAAAVEGQFDLSDKEVGEALLEGGYTFEEPEIDHFAIADFRKFGSGHIEDLGIVDPKLVGSGGMPYDGTVTIDGRWLDLPGTTVRMVHDEGTTEGEVVTRSGGSGSSELDVELEDFRSGTLEVQTLGGVATVPALALSYRQVALNQLFNPTSTLIMGDASGTLVYGFTTGSASIADPGTSSQDMNPIAIIVSDEPGFSVVGSSNWDLTVQATFPFNPAVTGTWQGEVEYWACGSFEIPVSHCSSLNATCIADQLGSAFQSALMCTNPANWEKESQPGPPLPLVAQGVGSVSYTAHIDMGPSGLTSSAGTPAYSCTIVPADASSAPMAGQLQLWSNNNLGPAVMGANEGFHDAVLDRLEDWRLFLPGLEATGAELRGAYGLPSGKVLLEFHH